MKEDYEPVGRVIINKESIFNTIDYLPTETCAEKVIGRCKGCSTSDSKNCLNYQPARIIQIK